MKMNQVAIVAVAALFAASVQAESISVSTLTKLSDNGQLVQLKPYGGNCTFQGFLDAPGKTVVIERAACADESGATVVTPLSAKANVDETLPIAVGAKLELVAEYSTYQADPVRVAGDLMVCPPGHTATGGGIERNGCVGADPISFDSFAETVCPGGRVLGVTPQLSKTEPVGVVGLSLSIAPATDKPCRASNS